MLNDKQNTPAPEISPHIRMGLYLTCGLLATLILIIDLNTPLGVAGGVPYIAVVLLSLRLHDKRFTLMVAIICSVLTLIGLIYSPMGGELWKVYSNRALALFAIWVTAILASRQQMFEREMHQQHLQALRDKRDRELQAERLRILKSTMRTVHDIVNNFLNNMQLFLFEAEEKNALSPESFEHINTIIDETSTKLKTLGDLEEISEREMSSGDTFIDYENSATQKNIQTGDQPESTL